MDRRVYLKVKIKSLAEEARIIKHEERKRKVPRLSRKDRRIRDVALRNEMRASRELRRSRDWYPRSAAELHELHLHRINVVRKELRLSNIAYGFIRGLELSQVDSGARLTSSDWKRVGMMVEKYGAQGSLEGFLSWNAAVCFKEAA